MFKDREQAGYLLAAKLQPFKGKQLVVLAIPRGGLPLGAIIAESLNCPLDVALSKKIGHPYNKEYAIGAAGLDGYFLNTSESIPQEYIEAELNKIQNLLQERSKLYHRKIAPVDLKNKWIIIVDDGIATGNTVLLTAALVRKQQPDWIIVATPVAPPGIIEILNNSKDIDEVICLETPSNFQAVGQFYEDFDAVSDEEAVKILENSAGNGID